MFIAASLILILTTYGFTQESKQDQKIDCNIWRVWTNEQRTLYLVGYSDVIAIISFSGAVSGKSPEEINQIVHALWPKGYNLGQLGDELDKLCPTQPFKNMRVSLVITGLAVKANRVKQ